MKNQTKPAYKSVVLLSSGLDSTVNLYQAFSESEVKYVLTFDYGQRAAKKEIERAVQLCEGLRLPHKVIELPWFAEVTSTSLLNQDSMVPTAGDVEIDSLQTSQQTAKSVWVPNRNGVFLNIAAAWAEGLGAGWVIPGFNREEAATFPDNSIEFIKAMDHCLSYSTSNQVKVKCFTAEMNKTEIVKRGRELDVPFELIWPCYFANDEICGECESCQRYLRAMREAGL